MSDDFKPPVIVEGATMPAYESKSGLSGFDILCHEEVKYMPSDATGFVAARSSSKYRKMTVKEANLTGLSLVVLDTTTGMGDAS